MFGRHGYFGRIKRRQDCAVGQSSFVYLDGQISAHHVLETAPQSPRLGSVATAHFEHVAKSLCDNQTSLCALAFQKRIGTDGGAVDNGRDVGRFGVRRCDAVQKSKLDIGTHRGHLGNTAGPVCSVDIKHIGESAADVDAKNGAAPAVHTAFRAVEPSFLTMTP